MRDAARAHGHALAALAHAAASVERLRHQDIPREGILFRQQRLVAQGEARRLEFRYHELADLYATFASQAGNSAATAWQRFFDRYADFLDALRRARSEIARAQPPGPPDDGLIRPNASDCLISAGASNDIV